MPAADAAQLHDPWRSWYGPALASRAVRNNGWRLQIMTSLAAFTEVTRDQAITAFGGSGQTYCDGQIVVVGSAILLFATLGDGSDDTRLTAADSLEWRPKHNDYHPEEEIPWLPAAAIPCYDHDRKTWLTHSHILLRRQSHADRWLYCGGPGQGRHRHDTLGGRQSPGHAQ